MQFIQGPVGPLEIKVTAPIVESMGIVCHPHPLQGGTMNNKVVTTVVRAWRELGILSVCFNFRGVGKSAGEYAKGKGEIADLQSVIEWTKATYQPKTLILAGFSFGSYVAYRVAQLGGVDHCVCIAPPVERFEFKAVSLPCSLTVVQGEQDEVVSPEHVYQWVNTLPLMPALIRMPSADHFFHGQLIPLREQLIALFS